MRVGLNLLHLVPGETGGSELYVRRLIPALLAHRDDLRLTLFAAREALESLHEEDWGSDAEIVQVRVSARSRPRRVLAEQLLLPGAVRKARLDLLHNAFTTAPAIPGVPQVTTILDVIYKRFPDTHAGLFRYGMAVLVPLAARRSRRILTLSEAAKEDIVRFLEVDPERIDVTPLGPALPQATAPVNETEIRKRFQLGDSPLILTVSAKRPHKNLKRLIDAVTRLEGAEPVLLVPGYATPFEEEMRAWSASLPRGERIRFTGWVDDATLEGLYEAATCFVFPSLAEGFGLPVLDAFVRAVPVACSNTSSLPEIAGDAALYFDPTDVDSIAGAMQRLLGGGELRRSLAKRGIEQAHMFTWERTAARTRESYDRALDGRSGG